MKALTVKDTAKVTPEFAAALDKFATAAEAVIAKYESQYDHIVGSSIMGKVGQTMVKIIKTQTSKHGDRYEVEERTYCYVDRTTGAIYKAAGRHGVQDKRERGNIFSAQNGAEGVTWFGAKYVGE